MRKILLLFIILLTNYFSFTIHAKVTTYDLVINEEYVNITGKKLKRITVNNSIPGPVLEFTEGDEAIINVTNNLKVKSSVHWHGLLLPGEMDGVPGFNGFTGINTGETFTYKFTIRQKGTYWYHAHSNTQEQDGLYGSIIIHPKEKIYNNIDRDYVILLSDFHNDSGNEIFANLKKSSEYYVYIRRTMGDFFRDMKKNGMKEAFENSKMWGEMRMRPSDLADINDYIFLVNGQTNDKYWQGKFKKGEKIRLRFINASAMSFFDVRIDGLRMKLIEADGQPVEPLMIDEFRFGVAETYDVIVEPNEDKAFAIIAEPIDRNGMAIAALQNDPSHKINMPKSRERSFLTMADMGVSHNMHGKHANHKMERSSESKDHSNHNQHANHNMEASSESMDHSNHNQHTNHNMEASSESMDHSNHNQHTNHNMDKNEKFSNPTNAPIDDFVTGTKNSGWADAKTPVGKKALEYKDLRYYGIQKDQRYPSEEIIVKLGGNMERYIWTLNDKKYEDSGPIDLTYGRRYRLTFINDTMMAHPMHLHGMFMQLENGQPMEKLPNKHTVIIAPGDKYSVLLTADEVGEWAFHCHLLYHMMSGMMTKVVVAKLDENNIPKKIYSKKSMDHENHTQNNKEHDKHINHIKNNNRQ